MFCSKLWSGSRGHFQPKLLRTTRLSHITPKIKHNFWFNQRERETQEIEWRQLLISIISLEHLQRCSVCDSPTVKFIAKRSKCAGLAQEIGFPAPNSCSLLWLVKGATQLCTSRKTCNKLHLTVAQYFWLVDHNDWSRWLAISSSPCIYSSGFKFIDGVGQKK